MPKIKKPKKKKNKAIKKKNIDVFDKSLLHYLLKIKGRATTNRIAQRTKMSWNTAEKHLKKMQRADLVKSEREKRKKFWKVNRKISAVTQNSKKPSKVERKAKIKRRAPKVRR